MPKLENLHLLISSITGTPRIVNANLTNKDIIFANSYKDIPKEEWDSALINYYSHFDLNTRQFIVAQNDWTFVIGGKFDDPDKAIQCLENCIKEIKEMKEETNEH